jgi:hypothetical protein
VAVEQGIKYRDALQSLIALREGTGEASGEPAPAAKQQTATVRSTASEHGNGSSAKVTGRPSATLPLKQANDVGSVTYYSNAPKLSLDADGGQGALEEELKKSCAAVVLGQGISAVAPESPVGYQNSINLSALSSPSPYQPRVPELWTPESDRSLQAAGSLKGATVRDGKSAKADSSGGSSFDENAWKKATEACGKEVSLVNLGLSSATVPRVHRLLSQHAKSVQRLDLSYNYLRNSGAIALVGVGWPVLGVLQHLDLADNQIGDSGVAAVSEAAARLKALSSLALGGNLITKQGAASLAAGLRSATLTSLHLDFNTIGDEGAISLTFALTDAARLPALTSLHLNSNKIGREGIEALVESATKEAGSGYASALQQLYVRGNVAAVGAEVQRLLDLHPKLTVFA